MRGCRVLAGLALGLLLSGAGSCAEDVPTGFPPPTCGSGERFCYYERVLERTLLLRCNEGEPNLAAWLVEDVCDEGDGCDVEAGCTPAP